MNAYRDVMVLRLVGDGTVEEGILHAVCTEQAATGAGPLSLH